jgi:hypothetical protein
LFCNFKIFSDPLLTQNTKKAGRAEWKQWKIRRANGSKKHKSELKRLQFVLETTYGPEGRGFESLTACHPEIVVSCNDFGVFAPFFAKKVAYFRPVNRALFPKEKICLTLV